MEKTLKKQNISKPTFALTKKTTFSHFISILGFFIGRIIMFRTLNPIAIAYLAAYSFSPNYYITAVFVFLGVLTRYKDIYISRYILAVATLTFINIIAKQYIKKPTPFLRSLSGGIATLFAGLLFAVINGFSLYFTTLAFLESALTIFLSYIFHRGTAILCINTAKRSIEHEELLSLCLIAFGVIVGSADIYIGGIPIMYFFIILSLMVTGYKGGIALGISGAGILGTILVFSGYQSIDIIPILLIAECALTISHGKHKILSITGFLAGGAIGLFYFNPSLYSTGLLYSAILASVVFYIIPDKLYVSIATSLETGITSGNEYISQIKEVTYHKLKRFSGSFNQLSKTLNNLSEHTANNDHKDVTSLVDDIANKVCNNCSLKMFCWEDQFYDTYQTIFSILASCEAKGTLDPNVIPNIFKSNCVRLEEFISTTSRIYELNKLNQIWRKQIAESRGLVSQQLASVSHIIDGLRSDLEFELNFSDKLSSKLYTELSKNQISVYNAVVHQCADNRTEVLITHKPCYSNKCCTKEIIPIVNNLLGKRMSKDCYECQICNSPKTSCRLRLIEEKQYRISTYVAKAIKTDSKISGDSHTFMELSDGNYLLALSDGMGSGNRAREESAASIELFEDFMSAGFDKNTAINMINSVLVLKSSEDFFSTLDICTVNLYTGLAEFVKIGASSTFIVRNDKVEVIKSSTLPVGILDTVDTDAYERLLQPDDMIVMVTDGVLDSIDSPLKKEDWIVELISSRHPSQPQELAQLILTEAKRNTNHILNDDMTVLAAKIWS